MCQHNQYATEEGDLEQDRLSNCEGVTGCPVRPNENDWDGYSARSMATIMVTYKTGGLNQQYGAELRRRSESASAEAIRLLLGQKNATKVTGKYCNRKKHR